MSGSWRELPWCLVRRVCSSESVAERVAQNGTSSKAAGGGGVRAAGFLAPCSPVDPVGELLFPVAVSDPGRMTVKGVGWPKWERAATDSTIQELSTHWARNSMC